MKSAYPHAPQRHPQKLINALAHFSRRFVGKGNRQDAVRGDIVDLNFPGDTMHQYPRFTTASSGQNKQMLFIAGHCLFLRSVEIV